MLLLNKGSTNPPAHLKEKIFSTNPLKKSKNNNLILKLINLYYLYKQLTLLK